MNPLLLSNQNNKPTYIYFQWAVFDLNLLFAKGLDLHKH